MTTLNENNLVVEQPDTMEVSTPTPIPTPARKKPAKKKEVNYKVEYNKAAKEIETLKAEVEAMTMKAELLFNENQRLKKQTAMQIQKMRDVNNTVVNIISGALNVLHSSL